MDSLLIGGGNPPRVVVILALVSCAGLWGSRASASPALMQEHCLACHNEEKAKGKFELGFLGDTPTEENLEHWLDSLDYVVSEEMPPEDESELTPGQREELIDFLESKVKAFEKTMEFTVTPKPRRLNNREFANSVRDVLLLENVGTNVPMDNLIGDALHHGFDTHGETLSFSRFHLEQYIEAVRKVLDATIMSGERPKSRRIQIPAERIVRQSLNQNVGRPDRHLKEGVFDFLDPRLAAQFPDFGEAPAAGYYKINIKATGTDRGIYDADDSGFYHGDPIQLSVHLGDQVTTYDLPDDEVIELELTEWLGEGTVIELRNPTDAFTMRGNGNFKFQYALTPTHLKKYDSSRYEELVSIIEASPDKNSRKGIDTWHNWTKYWMGARPQVFSVEIEGPFYHAWPPKRQVALLGVDPSAEKAIEILRPIANRAWRRPVQDGELQKIVDMVQLEAETMGDIEALKEGIVAILVAPSFLMTDLAEVPAGNRFASKLSYLLRSTTPRQELREKVGAGRLASFDAVREEIAEAFESGGADEFLNEFPFAWLELNDINFMAPDPEHYRFYHKKRVSEDMVNEVLAFFENAVRENLPLPEFLSADYSFINADLASIYGVKDVPEDSVLRKYQFTDGRRGGLLGMGAFLTATADSLSTSPIHRAVFVMENFMGIHPTPPPPDVIITEPDVRNATTIKEVLAAHTEDANCASCHETIDPWGYAFENFDPTGAWRDVYVVPASLETDEEGELIPGEGKPTTVEIDASARFRNGIEYQGIVEFRRQILTEGNRDRFVRCFIEKLLTYANGAEPEEIDFVAIDRILEKSAECNYRIVDTISAVVDSELFRGE
ncbi:MAG: DUF1588 domain-containing protein [Verrucomicrobiales bacterium]|nr:DUF1588 domain-containing protein [Verrucomicrobiales bacterium]